jgi:hypothetical protein
MPVPAPNTSPPSCSLRHWAGHSIAYTSPTLQAERAHGLLHGSPGAHASTSLELLPASGPPQNLFLAAPLPDESATLGPFSKVSALCIYYTKSLWKITFANMCRI